MKKLMIIAGLALAAGFASASTVQWSVSNVYKYGTDTSDTANKAPTGSYYVMCFIDTETVKSETGIAYNTLSVAQATEYASKGDFANLSAKAMTVSGTLTSNGGFASAALDGKWDANDYVKVYALIFDASAPNSAEHFIVTATKDVTFADGTTTKVLSLGSQKSATWNKVESVPEPTSGVLLMIGVVGLALRRRKA